MTEWTHKRRATCGCYPLKATRNQRHFLRTEFNEEDGHFSPDGHYVAYTSDESGRNEIYVRTFSADALGGASDTGGKWLISTGGGIDPRWRRDGKELYYVAADGRLMAVDVAAGPGFQASAPKVLFQLPALSTNLTFQSWDVSPDGKRFLFPVPVSGQDTTPFTVVLNWQAGLKK